MKNAKKATVALLNEFKNDPERFSGNSQSEKAIRAYYKMRGVLKADFYGENIGVNAKGETKLLLIKKGRDNMPRVKEIISKLSRYLNTVEFLRRADYGLFTKSVNGEPSEKRSSDTMGTKRGARFGLYKIKGSINVHLAQKTGFSEEYAKVLKECLRNLFENDCSSARPDGSVEVLKVYCRKHNCATGAIPLRKGSQTGGNKV